MFYFTPVIREDLIKLKVFRDSEKVKNRCYRLTFIWMVYVTSCIMLY